jgi:cobalt/nickel transport protein
MKIKALPVAALTAALAASMAAPLPARAHFLELIPSTDILTADGSRSITLDAVFTHPFERGPAMEMAPPTRFGVRSGKTDRDLKAQLEPLKVDGKSAYRARFTFSEPGDYVFYMAPSPYWEAAEGKSIIHYTKVVVDAFGGGDGWDSLVGLPVEIEPLVRPYGLWTGNAFSGIVRKAGKPVPFATVEVEWKNDGTVKAPADPFVTQVVKADAGGAFTYVMPRAGWWGFAALIDGDKPLPGPDGKPAPVELGALMWVRATDMK